MEADDSEDETMTSEKHIIIEVLPDGRYAITKENYEAQQKAWLDSIRQAQQEAYEEAANICDKMKEKAYEDGEGSTDIPAWINNCSNIIRALKTKP